MQILFIGDAIGRPGRAVVAENLRTLKQEFHIDVTILNGENVAGGIGITKKTAQKLFNAGVDVITTGNHTWKYNEIENYIREQPNLLRPLNFPPGTPGRGSVIFRPDDKLPLAIVNVMGRTFMRPIDCPFRAIDAELNRLKDQTNLVLVDFHAEATSEKNAFGLYVDGKVSAVLGTHTHIQTADERILPKGTAFITDVGMVGGLNSVIGSQSEAVIASFITGRPHKFEPEENNIMLNAVVIEINENSGQARSIERLRRFYKRGSIDPDDKD